MLGISTTNARVGGFRSKGLDANAAAFIAAAGITDTTQKSAINRLVKNYKGIGDLNSTIDFWTNSIAIYPYVGGTATSHKFNLRNPLDTDAAFRIVWSGGVTHNANGITGNGTNGFGDTFIVPSVNMSINGIGATSYDRTNTVGLGRYTFGAFQTGIVMWHSYADTQFGYLGSLANVSFNDSATPKGFKSLQRTASNVLKGFSNGVQVGTTVATTITNLPTNKIQILAANGLAFYSDHNLGFNSFGIGMSDANALIQYNFIQAFQTDLGRQV